VKFLQLTHLNSYYYAIKNSNYINLKFTESKYARKEDFDRLYVYMIEFISAISGSVLVYLCTKIILLMKKNKWCKCIQKRHIQAIVNSMSTDTSAGLYEDFELITVNGAGNFGRLQFVPPAHSLSAIQSAHPRTIVETPTIMAPGQSVQSPGIAQPATSPVIAQSEQSFAPAQPATSPMIAQSEQSFAPAQSATSPLIVQSGQSLATAQPEQAVRLNKIPRYQLRKK
jgi:hypothetical protein